MVEWMRTLWLRSRSQDSGTSLALLVLRGIAGGAMVLHGLPKIVTPTSWMGDALPGWLQLLAAFAEVGGGVAWIFGLLTPVAALGLGITMVTAMVIGHLGVGDPLIRLTVQGGDGPGDRWGGLPTWLVLADGRSPIGSGSAELAMLFSVISLVLLLAGPGRFSLDAWLARRVAKSAT